jgi:predicted HicB family RNase H-like nuclease
MSMSMQDEKLTKAVFLRIGETMLEKWKQKAKKAKRSLSDWIRLTVEESDERR